MASRSRVEALKRQQSRTRLDKMARQAAITAIKNHGATWDWEHTPEISYIAIEAPPGFVWADQQAHTLICQDWHEAMRTMAEATLIADLIVDL